MKKIVPKSFLSTKFVNKTWALIEKENNKNSLV